MKDQLLARWPTIMKNGSRNQPASGEKQLLSIVESLFKKEQQMSFYWGGPNFSGRFLHDTAKDINFLKSIQWLMNERRTKYMRYQLIGLIGFATYHPLSSILQRVLFCCCRSVNHQQTPTNCSIVDVVWYCSWVYRLGSNVRTVCIDALQRGIG